MKVNDPLETEDSPLFQQGQIEYNNSADRNFPTVNMTSEDVQIIESKHIQTDQGANISICVQIYLLIGYTLITPFNIGHASNKGPPLVAIRKGYMEIITTKGTTIKTPLYYFPNALGTLLSADLCAWKVMVHIINSASIATSPQGKVRWTCVMMEAHVNK